MTRHETVGKYFKQQRIKAKLTQAEIAMACGFTTAQMVSNWERGMSSPPKTVLGKLYKKMKLDKQEVLTLLLDAHKKEYSKALRIR